MWEFSVSRPERQDIWLLGLACDVHKDDFEINYDISLSELHRKVVKFYLKLIYPNNTKLVRFSQFVQRLFGGFVDLRSLNQLNPLVEEKRNTLPPIADQLADYSFDMKIPAFYRGRVSTVCPLGCDRTRNQKGEISLFLNFEPSNQWISNNIRDNGTHTIQGDRAILSQMLSQSRRLAMDPTKDPWERLLRRTVPVHEIEEVHATKRIVFQVLDQHGELMYALGVTAENVRQGDLIYQFLGCDVAIIFRYGTWPGTTGGSRPLPISVAVISAPFIERASNPFINKFGHDIPRPAGRRSWKSPGPLTASQQEAMARSISLPGNISEETLSHIPDPWSHDNPSYDLVRSRFEYMHPGQPYLNRSMSSSQGVPPGWVPPQDGPLSTGVQLDAIITDKLVQTRNSDDITFYGERFSEDSSVVFMYRTGSELATEKQEEIDPDLPGNLKQSLRVPPTNFFVFNFATLQLISRWWTDYWESRNSLPLVDKLGDYERLFCNYHLGGASESISRQQLRQSLQSIKLRGKQWLALSREQRRCWPLILLCLGAEANFVFSAWSWNLVLLDGGHFYRGPSEPLIQSDS